MGLMAGSAVANITPRTPCFLAGYAGRDHAHEGVHDPISLRALYVQSAAGDALLVSADIIWFYDDMVARIEAALERDLGLLREHLLLCGTHTHSAPTVSREHANREWMGMVENQVVAAAALAKTRLQPAVLRIGRGESHIGMNRREVMPDGEIKLGHNPDGPADHEVIVAAFDTEDDKPIARVCNYACHGVVLGQRNYQLSGDWMGHAASEIEKGLDGGALLFLNGGTANVDPRVRVQESFEPVEELGQEFVRDVKKACEKLSDGMEEDAVSGAMLKIEMPRKLRDVEAGMGKTRPISVRGIQLGALRIVGFPGEVFTETAMGVKAGSIHAQTMVCSYTCGGSGGYVPVAEAYETGGYEVRVSPYAEGAESVLRQGFLDLLTNL